MKRCILDIEANNLLAPALDYLTMPYRFKPDFKVWCVVIRDIDSNSVVRIRPEQLSKETLAKHLQEYDEIVGHNIIGYDFPVLMLYGLMDYRVGYPGEPSTVNGKIVTITDTLIWSKLLNADRLGGHSLDEWGKRLNNHKTAFNDFSQFSEDMLEYCVQDTSTNRSMYFKLQEEAGNWNWTRAYSVEIKLADLTLRQELFGFKFNSELAHKNLEELEKLMADIASKVNPILPMKRMTKGKMDDFTLPKLRFKKNGELSSNMLKFCEKTGATVDIENRTITLDGKTFPIMTEEPLKTHEVATIEDIDTVKAYLLSLGWVPSEVKERDLFKDAKKQLLPPDKVEAAIERYIKDTLASEFLELRCSELGTTPEKFKVHIYGEASKGKRLYVPTTPKLTIGVEKTICPNLVALGEKAEFVKSVVEYYTYRHRRNSIAGGVVDEDGEPETGFLSCVREDGRIPTPADTLGANTGRYRHKIVCNVPRVTSLYGEPMRNLFECGEGLYQLGYDFASLEARIMGHYVIGTEKKPYTDGMLLAQQLVAEKPNDIHSVNAKKLGISRSDAKSFSYAAIYGAQPKKLAKMLGISEREGKQLFEDYWNAVPALKELKESVERYWESCGKSYIMGLDGRKLVTRSKHSLINVLFQSGGAISAKWAAVRMTQEMENRGILGDPFVHTKQEQKVWWMIHMHDEQQMAVHPSLMKIKPFATEEEAKANLVAGCSAVGHGAKGYYVGLKTEPVECIEKGINRAAQELKLRVELGFEWIPGKSWGQCH